MQVVNVLPDPRHYSYASRTKNGKTLQPGEAGPELPLDRIHEPRLQHDLSEGKIQIRLSDADRKFLLDMVKAADAPVAVKTRPAPPKPKKVTKARKSKAKVPGAPKPQLGNSKVEPAFSQGSNPSLHDLIQQNRMGVPDLEQVGAGRGNVQTVGVPAFDTPKSTPGQIRQHLGGRF